MNTMNQAKRFQQVLSEEWERTVYDAESNTGFADTGIGEVNFRESNNDPAVIVELPMLRFKTTAEDAKRVLDAIAAIMRTV